MTEPWFLRGTAVTPEIFEAQLDWVLARYEVVSLLDLMRGPTDIPRVALTFDDGYREVGESVATVCSSREIPATCFASAGPAFDREMLWFDAWYAVVTTGPAKTARRLLAEWGAPDSGDSPLQWVAGPTRQWLAALPTEVRSRCVAELLTIARPERPPTYLSVEELRSLSARGWTIGGHGARHPRLTAIDDAELAFELQRSVALLGAVGVRPVAFAYPDGDYDSRVVRAVAAAGFTVGCTVERGPLTPGTPNLLVPRLFCRGDRQVPHPALEVT